MEFDENREEELEPQYNDDEYVDIYSRRAIFWFATLFNTIFGGVLLVINLKAAGYKRAANIVLAFSFLYHIASLYAIRLSGYSIPTATIKAITTGKQLTPTDVTAILTLYGIVFAINGIGGLILSLYFFKKYFPDNDYYPRPVFSAVIVSLIISFVCSFILPNI